MAGDFDAIINQVLDQQPQFKPSQPPQGDLQQPVDLHPSVFYRQRERQGTPIQPFDLYHQLMRNGDSKEMAREFTGGMMRGGVVPMGDYKGQPLYNDPFNSQEETDEIMEAIPMS